jgi:hypothetical protein
VAAMLSGSPDIVECEGEGRTRLIPRGLCESPSDCAARLRERAERYSHLAETLSDPKIISVVQECVRELETEAMQQEQKRFL